MVLVVRGVILVVIGLAFFTWSGVEAYGRSVVGAFAVAVLVLALMGLVILVETRNRS